MLKSWLLRSQTLAAGVPDTRGWGPVHLTLIEQLKMKVQNDNELIMKLTGRRCNIYSRDFFSLILGFNGGLLKLTSAAAIFNLTCVFLCNLFQEP